MKQPCFSGTLVRMWPWKSCGFSSPNGWGVPFDFTRSCWISPKMICKLLSTWNARSTISTMFQFCISLLLSYTKMSCLGKVSIVCHWNFRLFLRLPDSSLEKPQDLPVPPVLFKLLRIGKLARAIRMITMTTMLLSLQRLGWKRGWHKKVIGLLDGGFTGRTHKVVPVENWKTMFLQKKWYVWDSFAKQSALHFFFQGSGEGFCRTQRFWRCKSWSRAGMLFAWDSSASSRMLSQILVQDFLQQHHQECFGQIWTKMRVAEEEEEEAEQKTSTCEQGNNYKDKEKGGKEEGRTTVIQDW